uniref:Uncharacterized protein MLCB1701.14 n=1 Tax=Mycobacterium leprae TaxID=1769 RepID=Q9Z5J7_MYCLR|nr:hypothetical protein MLCB1701.14 [Mycobacterium leprae]
MCGKGRLDFDWKDAGAAGDDHVGKAVYDVDVEVAIGLQVADNRQIKGIQRRLTVAVKPHPDSGSQCSSVRADTCRHLLPDPSGLCSASRIWISVFEKSRPTLPG